MPAEPELAELDLAEIELAEIMDKTKEYLSKAKAQNTVKGYRTDFLQFKTWCEQYQLPYLPTNDQTYALYLSSLAIDGAKMSTIRRKMSSIAQAHSLSGHPSPTTAQIKAVWSGIRRVHGTAETGKQPILIDTLKLMLGVLPDKLLGVRDKALLLIGFAGALRRSELVNLDVEHITVTKEGLTLLIVSSKTDQEAKGETIGIPYGANDETCPVKAYVAWIKEAGIVNGPIFRPINRHNQVSDKRLSDKAVALVVKRYVEAIGLNKDDYAGHSLRSGLATTAAMQGKSERSIMKQTRHRSDAMVRKYIRMGSLFIENAASGIGL
ncbi:site-specific integrase [Paenibacillus sp. Y412MC10]|uniref:site-specific integrase n=1 Tax=Geobacillus sp. (strain Y412MC10) TaxID=481743 RepID=UPI0021B2637D|nr:site-specific integrase [Paenibacillus sp. Y412MC10]